MGAFQFEDGIEYVKVPKEVFDVIATADNQGQQDKLFGAYCRHFATGDAGAVPKSIMPQFALIRGTADRIKTGILTGGRRKKGRRKDAETREKSVRSLEEVSEKSVRSLEEVCISSTSSQQHTGVLPAETHADPTTPPKTQYQYQYQEEKRKNSEERRKKRLEEIEAMSDEDRASFDEWCEAMDKVHADHSPKNLTEAERELYTAHAQDYYPLWDAQRNA